MLDIVVNNPFRALGVYSNAKQADILKNYSKMKAYLNVGKDVSFPADSEFCLGPICRTIESVQKAQADMS